MVETFIAKFMNVLLFIIGILEVQSYGPSCPQFPDLTFGDFPGSVMWNPPNEMNEDCLYLNVWTPNPRPKSAAVMVS